MKNKPKLMMGILIIVMTVSTATSWTYAKPPAKSKFYDFSEQVIDGEIRKPTNLYVDSRKKVKFERLLRLKKSFLPKLFSTAKERIFK